MRSLVTASSFALMILTAAGCDGDETSTSSPSGSTSSSSSSSSSSSGSSGSSGGGGAALVVGGVTIPDDLKLCEQNIVPLSSSTKNEFSWPAVPEATRYAVRATKTPSGGEAEPVFDGILEGTPEGATYTFEESNASTSYMVEVYALKGTEPLCTLGGMNTINR